jgi:dTDP-glucose 4,6-dehydratase
MKWLITGGAGFIGSNFLNLLVPRHPEHHFINLDQLTYAGNLDNLRELEGASNYSFERLDIADAQALRAFFERERPDGVVHFAAESHVDRSIVAPGAFITTNILGTFNLLEAARAIWPSGEGLFHHVSTDEVYGSLGDEGLFREDTPYDPSSPYSASKASSDHLVRAYGRTYGLPVKITNCSNNYGPYQFPEKLIPLMVMHAAEKRPLPIYGQGKNVRDWLYVEDHCEAIWTVIQKGRVGETYNIGGHNELSNIDVVDAICAVVAKEKSESVEELLALKHFVTDRPGHDFRYAIDSSKIQKECGWTPKEDFASGLRKTVRWYLDNPSWIERVRSGDYQDWLKKNYGARQTDKGTA